MNPAWLTLSLLLGAPAEASDLIAVAVMPPSTVATTTTAEAAAGLVFSRRTSLRAIPAAALGIEAEALARCPVERRFSCWLELVDHARDANPRAEARRLRYLLALVFPPGKPARVAATLYALDPARASYELVALQTLDWKDLTERGCFAATTRAKPQPAEPIEAALEAWITEDFKAALSASGHYGAPVELNLPTPVTAALAPHPARQATVIGGLGLGAVGVTFLVLAAVEASGTAHATCLARPQDSATCPVRLGERLGGAALPSVDPGALGGGPALLGLGGALLLGGGAAAIGGLSLGDEAELPWLAWTLAAAGAGLGLALGAAVAP